MDVEKLKLDGLLKIAPKVFQDERGFFLESFQLTRYQEWGMSHPFVQDNISFSKQGVLRGLHFDLAQGKLVTCVQGKIWDVAVDLRRNSSTFGQWEGVFLDDEKQEQIFIPAGFAHGFLVISPTAKVHYKVTTSYNPATEKSIRWNDPDLAIHWMEKNPILSERDRVNPFFKELFP